MFGFHRRIIGEVADRKDAPTIVLAPHSSFFDVGCGLALDDVPYAVSRAENMSIPLVGSKLVCKEMIVCCPGVK